MTGPEPGVALPLEAILGREVELAHVAGLLDETRFVTITGLGGAGKTRLALEVARRWTAAPVVFVDLSAVRDPSLFAAVVADALGADAPAQVEPEQAVAGVSPVPPRSSCSTTSNRSRRRVASCAAG